MSEEKTYYTYNEILEMVGGNEYYDEDQTKFIYFKCKGDEEQASFYLEECNKKNKKLEEQKEKMKTQKELEENINDTINIIQSSK